jgi:membrane-associated phospholipid phosphatase
MHIKPIVLCVIFSSGLSAAPALAQEPKIDSVTLARANKPILRPGELIGVLATTGIGMALDQTFRNKIHDPNGSIAIDAGNAIGSVWVYPTLLAGAVLGKAAGSKTLYGVSSRALKSVLVGGAGGMVLKVLVGRERPTDSPENNLKFHPVTFSDNSFPSGHTTVAFALATSFSREIDGVWDDVAFFSLASLTAYSRMHDDRHWFSDVVFGAGIGILSARFVHRREAKILVGKSVLGASLDF